MTMDSPQGLRENAPFWEYDEILPIKKHCCVQIFQDGPVC